MNNKKIELDKDLAKYTFLWDERTREINGYIITEKYRCLKQLNNNKRVEEVVLASRYCINRDNKKVEKSIIQALSIWLINGSFSQLIALKFYTWTHWYIYIRPKEKCLVVGTTNDVLQYIEVNDKRLELELEKARLENGLAEIEEEMTNLETQAGYRCI